jgi:hypothetical protein
LSPLGVTVAGSPSRAAACEASAESGVRLASGSIPVHADPCKGFTYVGMAKRALQVRNVYATAGRSEIDLSLSTGPQGVKPGREGGEIENRK